MTQPATAPDPTAPVPPSSVASQIEQRLVAALEPATLEVVNESWKHAGHTGDDGSGESHFAVMIESARFVGLSRVARQRLVNKALADLIDPGHIHALAIRARAPGEA